MSLLDNIDLKLISESSKKCKMFWCIPKQSENGLVNWDIEIFDSEGDDLSNWFIVLHILKNNWGVDFSSCREKHKALPRGILFNNKLYHGNNFPDGISLNDISNKMEINLGDKVIPVYNKRFSINKDDLRILQSVIDTDLLLQYTE